MEVDAEILADFLQEAGEILDELGEQLVDLEQKTDDPDLLNAIFRGFHTVKGGAGFLSLDPMVEICHRAEDVFNVLREGRQVATAEMIDLFLRALDDVNKMISYLRSGENLPPADPALLAELGGLLASSPPAAEIPEAPAPEDIQPVQEATTDLDNVMDGLYDALEHSPEKPATKNEDFSDNEYITEEEFDALLDELHGTVAPGQKKALALDLSEMPKKNTDEITEEEFDALLDELHGTGAPGQTEKAVTDLPGSEQSVLSPKKEKVTNKPLIQANPERNKTKAAEETSVRVDTSRLDAVMNLVGELVLVRNRLMTLRENTDGQAVAEAICNLDRVTSDLQSAALMIRMQPVRKIFGRFPRLVRDLARGLNKKITLEMAGEDTDLDKNLVEALADPLVHLVRNSVDHGIELPDIRKKEGKPEEGVIKLSAEQDGESILLTIEDDGAGIDAEKLRQKAVEKGLLDVAVAERLKESECYDLIFMPGFSMKEQISDVSGRGVGMDVVKTRISDLNGSVNIHSTLGEGTRLEIRVPLTLMILPTLMISVEDRVFAVPLAGVREVLDYADYSPNMVSGQKVATIRDAAVPLIYLSQWLQIGDETDQISEFSRIVVLQIHNHTVGLVVDKVMGQEEVVIKPLGDALSGLSGITGATITGDGGIALIIDVPGLLKAKQ